MFLPSSESVLERITALIGKAGTVTSRKMMGEYLLYLDGKLFGGIYDDRLLLKKTPVSSELIPGAVMASPYEGAKDMILIAEPDSYPNLAGIIAAMCR